MDNAATAPQTDPNAATAAPAKPKPVAKKNPNQSAIQVPKYATEIAEKIGGTLDEKAKHVIGAALLIFETLPKDQQVQAAFAARVKYAETAKTGD